MNKYLKNSARILGAASMLVIAHTASADSFNFSIHGDGFRFGYSDGHRFGHHGIRHHYPRHIYRPGHYFSEPLYPYRGHLAQRYAYRPHHFRGHRQHRYRQHRYRQHDYRQRDYRQHDYRQEHHRRH